MPNNPLPPSHISHAKRELHPNGPYAPSDEIDLFELIDDVLTRKYWVLGILVACLITAVCYLALATSIYQVQAAIQPPARQDLAALQVPGVEFELSTDEQIADSGFVLTQVMQQLNAFRFRMAYWQQHQQAFGQAINKNGSQTVEQQLEQFDDNNYSLHFLNPDKSADRDNYNGFVLTYPEGVKGVELAQGLLKASLASVKHNLISAWQSARHQQLQQLKHDLEQKRSHYRNQLASQKVSLDRALAVAQKMQLTDPITLGAFLRKTANNHKDLLKELNPDDAKALTRQLLVNDQKDRKLPLYLMGSRALQSELTAVEQQLAALATSSNVNLSSLNNLPGDKLISGLGAMKDKARYLKQLSPDFSQLKVAQISRMPTQPYGDIKPKSALVLAVGGLLGLRLGIFTALLMAAWSKRRT